MTKILPQELRTERLLLRRWRASDLDPFAALNSDPRVMEYFPALKSHEESVAAIKRYEAHFNRYSYGFWAVEIMGAADFAGFIGICNNRFDPQSPLFVEIGWRLAVEHWGHGYATEGARAALKFGFDQVHFDEIVSFTAVDNRRSRRVMEKLGMTHDSADDFDHPGVPVGHPVRRHVFYRISRTRFVDLTDPC